MSAHAPTGNFSAGTSHAANTATQAILDAVDVESLLEELKIPHTRQGSCALLSCPLGTHEDATPSFLFYYDAKRYECQSCHDKGDAIAFVAQITGQPRNGAAMWLARRFEVRGAATVSSLEIERWHEDLFDPLNQQSGKLLAVLKTRKGLTETTLRTYRIGRYESRIAIPIKDKGNRCTNVRLYDPFAGKKGDKYKNFSGAETAHGVFPADLPDDLNVPVFVCEGELKALKLRQYGFAAVSFQLGAGKWLAEWTPMFHGRRVFLCYDIDPAGQRAARRIAKDLFSVAHFVKIVGLDISPRDFPKGDVCDYFALANKTLEDFNQCVKCAVQWIPSQVRELDLDDKVYKSSLINSTHSGHYAKRVEVDAIVSAKDTSPYLVPSLLNVSCDRDQKCCVECPIYACEIASTGGVDVPLGPEDRRLLELVDVPARSLGKTLRSVVGIPERCGSSSCRVAETRNLEEVRLVPQLEVAQDDAGSVVVPAYYAGHGIETNTSYRLQMRVWPNAKTQHAVGLVYDAKPAQDNLSKFTLTPEDAQSLRVFQPETWEVDRIESKLDAIYEDFAANVTRIYQRRDLHMFMDLIWHTPLWFKWEGQSIKGWGDGLVLGDSGQGKTEVSRHLRTHFGCGEKIDSKSASVAGLLGGLQESGRRWMLQWGVIPLNDKRLVILEEVKGMSEEVIKKLTDMRSSGIAEIVKIEKRKTNARTRLLWITNPRSQRQIATYNHGVEAVKEFAGSLEDVRRYDAAIIVASGQVPLSVVNTRYADRDSVPPMFVSPLCRRVCLWAWSRTADQIVFESDAESAILSAATSMGGRYSSAIPLVESSDQRFKLARLAIALAARTFSCVPGTTDCIRVTAAHVQVVHRFLERLYDDPMMGYRSFSESHRAEEILQDEAEIQKELLAVPHVEDFIRAALSARVLNAEDMQNFSGYDRDSTQKLISLLVRKNALLALKRSFVKTPPFIAFLRKLQLDPKLAEQSALIKKMREAARGF